MNKRIDLMSDKDTLITFPSGMVIKVNNCFSIRTRISRHGQWCVVIDNLLYEPFNSYDEARNFSRGLIEQWLGG